MVIKIQEVGMRKITVFNFITLDGYFEGLEAMLQMNKIDIKR